MESLEEKCYLRLFCLPIETILLETISVPTVTLPNKIVMLRIRMEMHVVLERMQSFKIYNLIQIVKHFALKNKSLYSFHEV
jgi:hypothetical protein